MSTQTPLSRVEGLGAAHSGTAHFWRQRATAVALVPLAIWFVVAALGLVGGTEAETVGFFQRPLNAVLMAAFMVIAAYHMTLGLEVIIDDYVHSDGAKIFLMLLNRAFAIAVGAACLLALLRIVI